MSTLFLFLGGLGCILTILCFGANFASVIVTAICGVGTLLCFATSSTLSRLDELSKIGEEIAEALARAEQRQSRDAASRASKVEV